MALLSRVISARAPTCERCGIQTLVRLEHEVHETILISAWHCLRCHAFWLATPRVMRAQALAN